MKPYFAFQWHITDDCDQRCKHCYIFSGNNMQELTSMTWQQMQSVIADCEDMCNTYNSFTSPAATRYFIPIFGDCSLY